jgi:hypothetical protein
LFGLMSMPQPDVSSVESFPDAEKVAPNINRMLTAAATVSRPLLTPP